MNSGLLVPPEVFTALLVAIILAFVLALNPPGDSK